MAWAGFIKIKMLPMTNLMLVSILSSIFIVTLLSFPSPAEADYLYHVCPNTTTFTPNSTFQSNLNRLLSTLSSNATRPSGFYNATASSRTPNDAVYGLFLCRGDVAATDACKSCVSTATSDIVQRCPTEKQVVIWYDDCMLRYSNESFFSTMAEAPRLFMFNTQNVSGYVTDQNRFNQVLAASASELIAEASNNNRKFATKEANVSKVITLYVLGQCTQDLSSGDCNWCLPWHNFLEEKSGDEFCIPVAMSGLKSIPSTSTTPPQHRHRHLHEMVLFLLLRQDPSDPGLKEEEADFHLPYSLAAALLSLWYLLLRATSSYAEDQ